MPSTIPIYEQSLEAYMYYALRHDYPNPVSAKTLMMRAAPHGVFEPVTAFVSLCITFQTLNKRLGNRCQVVRSGVTPDDMYSLRYSQKVTKGMLKCMEKDFPNPERGFRDDDD
jgi:hypothetical protein